MAQGHTASEWLRLNTFQGSLTLDAPNHQAVLPGSLPQIKATSLFLALNPLCASLLFFLEVGSSPC